MNPRASLLLLALMLPAATVRAGTPLQLTPLQPALPAQVVDLDGHVMFQNPTYQTFDREPFGSSCRICATDVIQGALNDCSLLSALAAVAIVSPGTIKAAITKTADHDANGDFIYLVQYDKNGTATSIPITSAFPALPVSTFNKWVSNIKQRGYLWSPLTPFFVYAQLPAHEQSAWSAAFTGIDDSTWPMLMEKAYMAMAVPGGYGDTTLYNAGLDPRITLSQVADGTTHQTAVRTMTGSKLVSVWVHDSPAVADRGGHSVILGLLRGTLKAIEPNLRVCVAAPSGQSACAPTCHESHECHASLPRPLTLKPGDKVRVQVTDIDRPGSEHPVATRDMDPTQCTDAKPCSFDVPADSWVLGGPLIVSFGQQADPLVGLDALLSDIRNKRRAAIVGTVLKDNGLKDKDKGCPAGDTICAQMLEPVGPLEWGHAYYFMNYVDLGGPLKDNSVVFGNPHGGKPNAITLEQFYHAFVEIYDNPTKNDVKCSCN